MIVLIDGKKVECNESVKVIYDDEVIDIQKWKEVKGDVHLTINNEGLMTDVFVGDALSKTCWNLVGDLVQECH